MFRMPLPVAVGALVLMTSSCSQSEAASVAGEYALDVQSSVAATMLLVPGSDTMPAKARAGMEKTVKEILGTPVCTLNADLTFEIVDETGSTPEAKKTTEKGTWSVEDGAITLKTTHIDAKASESTNTGTLKDGKLAIQITKDATSLTMKFVKAKK